MIDGIVAIVGRPNVGKSSFFNRLLGSRVSIVEDEPGITRDRIYGKAEWLTKSLRLIDTGGFQLEDQPFQEEINAQVDLAIDESDVIIFIVDGQTGLCRMDEEIAQKLFMSKKPVVLAVNKIDDVQFNHNIYEFYGLGLGDPIACSSAHGIGIGDVLDHVVDLLPSKTSAKSYPNATTLAIIGQPNVGKSSLLNAILNEERTIVSDIEGTTRDAVDTEFKAHGQNYVAIDTAGIRRKGKVFESTEKYSVLRALGAIERADVALFVIDGEKGIRQQDKTVAGYAHNEGKPVIIVYNKWDLIEKDTNTMAKIKEEIKAQFLYLSYAPILFVSAKTKSRIDGIIPMVDRVVANSQRRIPTSVVNEVVTDATTMSPPPSHQGHRLKIYYVSQVSTQPPTFVFFVNDPDLCHFSYQRYLENRFREAFELEGTPIRMIFRKKDLS